jgi:hypothetical protein
MKTMIATLCAGKGLLNHLLLSARLLLAAAVPSKMLVFFLCRESISLIIPLALTRSSAALLSVVLCVLPNCDYLLGADYF